MTEDSNLATGTATSSQALKVKMPEPAPRMPWQPKQREWNLMAIGTSICGLGATAGLAAVAIPPLAIALGVVAAVGCAYAIYQFKMAVDPVDTNFRAIAKPKTLPAPKVVSGEGVSAAAAAAVNRLLALQVKQIGLAGAIVTAFNRSQGAHVKKQTAWEKKQVMAAGDYAAQLSALMLAEAKLRPGVRRAFPEPIVVTEDQAYEFGESLVFDGRLPPSLVSGLTKLGLTKVEQEEIRGQLIATDPRLYDGDAAAAFAEPQYLSLLRQAAADLKSFAKKAAKDPLNTGN